MERTSDDGDRWGGGGGRKWHLCAAYWQREFSTQSTHLLFKGIVQYKESLVSHQLTVVTLASDRR